MVLGLVFNELLQFVAGKRSAWTYNRLGPRASGRQLEPHGDLLPDGVPQPLRAGEREQRHRVPFCPPRRSVSVVALVSCRAFVVLVVRRGSSFFPSFCGGEADFIWLAALVSQKEAR